MSSQESKEPSAAEPDSFDRSRELAWRRRAKTYIVLHALMCLNMYFVAIEPLCSWAKAPELLSQLADFLADFGGALFFLTSPFASLAMLLGRCYDREWVYLAICNIFLSLLLFCAAGVACM